jgi:hypothetical protein
MRNNVSNKTSGDINCMGIKHLSPSYKVSKYCNRILVNIFSGFQLQVKGSQHDDRGNKAQ